MKIINTITSPNFGQLYIDGSAFLPMAELSQNMFSQDTFSEAYQKLDDASIGRDVFILHSDDDYTIKNVAVNGNEELLSKSPNFIEAIEDATYSLLAMGKVDIPKESSISIKKYHGKNVVDVSKLDTLA